MNNIRLNITTVMLISILTAIGIAPAHAQTPYQLDPAHTSFSFSVSHLGLSEVKGSFSDFEGTITYDPDNPTAAEGRVIIQAASIDTGVDKRDAHLKSPDFFNVDEHPKIIFQIKGINRTDTNHVVVGDLTIKGITKTISIPSKLVGPIPSPFGPGKIIGITGETVIDRRDFDITWNKTLDNGGMVVGNDVTITVNVEAQYTPEE